jgi:hypothetical protein
MTTDRQHAISRIAEAMKLKQESWGYVEALHEAARIGASPIDAIKVADRVCFGSFQHMEGKGGH